MAKDRTPDSTGGKRTGSSRSGAGAASGKGGRTRPAASVVAPQRPWGLIAGAVAVVVFAAAVITYAVLQVNKANEDKIESIDEIAGVETYDYPAGQEHVAGAVSYEESPPVGGPHAPPPDWADCTGTVYDVDIRHENAVHSLEHGAVWVTYNPDEVSGDDVDTLAALVTNEAGRMLSPYAGLDSPISIQAWGHQLKVDSADDPRLVQFADFLTLNSEFTPEPGASCENPTFAANPLVAEAAPAQ
ncbi:DUF3105 domain-containing protein [Blastococcus sp. CT_GayMR20]|uniref:DUF3105 domain-containing protein n=1 Tax=Blastococcus sp. CT_GayMR20 TaxID=2559609 RepID=UPI0010749017|nr:DUF3105 domain-containing protein [Blastococcus sp. CT_GayMR20]TFV68815.1 DUF3105 domain-containing protein [Blastococcus sp. CT_GayMR20]